MLVAALPASAMAQGLPDPTRPPAGFIDPADVKPGNAVGAVDTMKAGAEPALSLQSVLLPEQGKPVAVISGKYLPLGASVDGWELKSVSEHDAVLVKAGEQRILKLTPLVSKTMVAPRPTETRKKPVRAPKAKKSGTKESELKR